MISRLAKIAYETYADTTGGPDWEDLTPFEQEGWVAAVRAVVKYVDSEDT